MAARRFLRLNEFSVTGSGALTLDEFLAIELDEECDPPAFTRARLTAQDKLMLEAVCGRLASPLSAYCAQPGPGLP
jgi:hypothetical protein